VTSARAGDTITVVGDGPFLTEPVHCQGKALTLRAAPGSRPCLRLLRRPGSPSWQPLLTTDRPLIVEGIDFCREADAGTSGEPAHLIYCEGASLHLNGCRLVARQGSAAVVCRGCRCVELRDCQLVARTLALCVEVGETFAPEVRLAGCTVDIESPGGTALSLWAAECYLGSAGRPPTLRLESNRLRAGHVLALTNLAQGVEVTAHDNELTFRHSLASFAGLPGPDEWARRCTWRGARNAYRGTGYWLWVEGTPVGVRNLEGWRALWGTSELGSSCAPCGQ
jgi:hypothetical protein